MAQDKIDKHELTYIHEDHVATQKDLKILSLEIEANILNLKMELETNMLNIKMELENKITAITIKLGSLIIATSGILFGLLSYFHK